MNIKFALICAVLFIPILIVNIRTIIINKSKEKKDTQELQKIAESRNMYIRRVEHVYKSNVIDDINPEIQKFPAIGYLLSGILQLYFPKTIEGAWVEFGGKVKVSKESPRTYVVYPCAFNTAPDITIVKEGRLFIDADCRIKDVSVSGFEIEVIDAFSLPDESEYHVNWFAKGRF